MRTDSFDDPFHLISAILTKSRSKWMQHLYPFLGYGKGVSIHYSCDIHRAAARRIKIGDSVCIASATWLNVPEEAPDRHANSPDPAIIIENGCKIGRRCMISARNLVHLGPDVLVGPSVLITDHSHEFSDPTKAIHAQGLTVGGSVFVERNCWLGHGAAVVATSGELVIGRNSIIGANAVVTHSVPRCSIVVGNPAVVVREYDPENLRWRRPNGATRGLERSRSEIE